MEILAFGCTVPDIYVYFGTNSLSVSAAISLI